MRWLFVLGLVTVCRQARADLVMLDFVAPESCPASSEVLTRVKELSGLSTDRGEPLQARATIEALPTGTFRLALVVRSESGESKRELESATCEDAVEAAALIIALALAERADEPPKRDEPPKPPAAIPPTQPPSPPPLRVEPPLPKPSPPTDWLLRAGPALTTGVVPGWGFGPALGLGAARGRWHAELTAVFLPAARSEVRLDGASAELSALLGGARLCLDALQARLSLGPCLSAELGQVRGAAVNISEPEARDVLFAATRAGAFTGYSPLVGFELALLVEAGLPLTSTRFVAEGVGTLYDPPAWTGRAVLFLGARL